jgi:hypothetical protein
MECYNEVERDVIQCLIDGNDVARSCTTFTNNTTELAFISITDDAQRVLRSNEDILTKLGLLKRIALRLFRATKQEIQQHESEVIKRKKLIKSLRQQSNALRSRVERYNKNGNGNTHRNQIDDLVEQYNDLNDEIDATISSGDTIVSNIVVLKSYVAYIQSCGRLIAKCEENIQRS